MTKKTKNAETRQLPVLAEQKPARKVATWRDGLERVDDATIDAMRKSMPVVDTLFLLTGTLGQDDDDVAELIQSIIGEDRELVPDIHGNWYLDIPKPDGSDSRVLFCAHLDTVHWRRKESIKQGVWKLPDDEFQYFMASEGNSILGADDRSGCAVLVEMIIAGVPGTYAFFTDEEIGRIGSEKAALHVIEKGRFDIAIQFDRRGYDSIITHQSSSRTASDTFGQALADRLNDLLKMPKDEPLYVLDKFGSFTDTYSLRGVVAECTNISVGYDNAHTEDEYQNLYFLHWLTRAAMSLDWESLPVERKPERHSYPYRGDRFTHFGGIHEYDQWDWPVGRSHPEGGTNGTKHSSAKESVLVADPDEEWQFGAYANDPFLAWEVAKSETFEELVERLVYEMPALLADAIIERAPASFADDLRTAVYMHLLGITK